MGEAIKEARSAGASGDAPVGALVLRPDGLILARAGNRVERDRDPTAHAEILAIRGACATEGCIRLSGRILVCTLEPCQMCAGAIMHARLAGIVFGCADDQAGAVISRSEILPPERIWHLGGVRSGECAALLKSFFCNLRKFSEA